jgi:hypothetical protein
MAHFSDCENFFGAHYGFTFYNPDLSTGSGTLNCGHSGTAFHDFAATRQRERQEIATAEDRLPRSRHRSNFPSF